MSLRPLPLLLLPALLGCGNPSLDVKIAALGGEVPGVDKGEFHRSGQPCVDCHGPYKGAQPEMILAGTIFALPGLNGAKIPVDKARITVVDSLGKANGVPLGAPNPAPKMTNCAGNFWFTADDLPVEAFPYSVKIECPDPGDMTNMTVHATQDMETRISREGSCNACHQGDKTQSGPGWVVCDIDAKNTGITVYPPISHTTCPQAFPATAAGDTGGVGP